jgi:hypothetical protein
MSKPRDEKDEKQEKDEKERNKQEEKSFEEKWQRDPLGAMIWALVLIWAGVVLLAENLGLLSGFNDFFGNLLGREPSEIPFLPVGAWSLFFLGVAVLLLIEVAIRLLVPTYRRPVLGTTILAIVFLGLSIGSWGLIWPLILIIAGVALLFGSLWRKG